MGRPRSPHGYAASKYNRLKHGAMLHEILPSRGPDRCPLSVGCPVAEDDELRKTCLPGDRCPWELWAHDRFVEDGRKHYARSLQWLSEEELDHILHELGILHMRRIRVSALTAKEGLLRDKVHPVSGYVYGQQAALGIGRYGTAIDTLFWPLMHQLVYSPEERAEMEAEARREREELFLPSSMSIRPPDPPPEHKWAPPPRRPDPTDDWFQLPRRWDHEPGKPEPEGA